MTSDDKQPTRFVPVVLVGLAGAVVLAVTAARPWVELELRGTDRVGFTEADLRADSPLALALALVVLAAWGVVLVSRTRARLVVLGLAALADLGVLACVLRAPGSLPDQISDQLALGDGGASSVTPAYVVAAVASVVLLVAIGVGLRHASRWPSMSSRYDAPTGRVAEAPVAEDADGLTLWKALDEGQDPTAR